MDVIMKGYRVTVMIARDFEASALAWADLPTLLDRASLGLRSTWERGSYMG
jgi:hypothetical protein